MALKFTVHVCSSREHRKSVQYKEIIIELAHLMFIFYLSTQLCACPYLHSVGSFHTAEHKGICQRRRQCWGDAVVVGCERGIDAGEADPRVSQGYFDLLAGPLDRAGRGVVGVVVATTVPCLLLNQRQQGTGGL